MNNWEAIVLGITSLTVALFLSYKSITLIGFLLRFVIFTIVLFLYLYLGARVISNLYHRQKVLFNAGFLIILMLIPLSSFFFQGNMIICMEVPSPDFFTNVITKGCVIDYAESCASSPPPWYLMKGCDIEKTDAIRVMLEDRNIYFDSFINACEYCEDEECPKIQYGLNKSFTCSDLQQYLNSQPNLLPKV